MLFLIFWIPYFLHVFCVIFFSFFGIFERHAKILPFINGKSFMNPIKIPEYIQGFSFILLRGLESNQGLEVLLHLSFPKGMDYTMIHEGSSHYSL